MKCPGCKNKESWFLMLGGEKAEGYVLGKKMGELRACKKCGLVFIAFKVK